MTGSRVCLRRWSGCNLHWYAPPYGRARRDAPMRQLYQPPPRYLRYKLYIPDEQYVSGSSRQGRDKHGTYVWMWPDCGWEWLSGRPVLKHRPFWFTLTALHDHVHTPHRKAPDRVNVPKSVLRAIVSGIEYADSTLDRIPSASVSSNGETLTFRFHRDGLWGCRANLAALSSRLDERWHTDVWKLPQTFTVQAEWDFLSTDEETSLLDELKHSAARVNKDQMTGWTQLTWTVHAPKPQDALRMAHATIKRAGAPDTRATLIREQGHQEHDWEVYP